jgi:hypothetical protein
VRPKATARRASAVCAQHYDAGNRDHLSLFLGLRPQLRTNIADHRTARRCRHLPRG